MSTLYEMACQTCHRAYGVTDEELARLPPNIAFGCNADCNGNSHELTTLVPIGGSHPDWDEPEEPNHDSL